MSRNTRRSLFAIGLLSCVFGSISSNTYASQNFKDAAVNTNRDGWFVGVGVGGSGIGLPGQTAIANGAPSPYNHDHFTVQDASADIAQFNVGYRFDQDRKYFPLYQLYLQYRHYISSDIRGFIDQYNLPGFKNYKYKVSYGADLFALNGKINIFEEAGWLPYFAIGGGVIINHLYNYNEFPLGVTPRINPDYAGTSSRKLALTLGVGIDYMLTDNVWATLGYDHIFQGNIKTGNGKNAWSNTKLYIGNVKMDTVFLNLTVNVPETFMNRS